MKKGIALLITIGFITVLTLLIGYMFLFSETIFKKVQKSDFPNQRVIIFDDIKSIMDTNAKNVKDYDDLSNFLYKIPPLVDKKNQLFLSVSMIPLSNKIDLNSVLVNKKVNKASVDFIRQISETYNVLDSHFLISLILDTIDTDDISREALSEISREDVKFSNGRIIDIEHFQKILEYYDKIVDDKSVFKIPWEKLIYLGSGKSDLLDCDRLSKELVNVLGLDLDGYEGCSSVNETQNIKISQKYNLKRFKKGKNYFIFVKIGYKIGKIADTMVFTYNINGGEVTNFDTF